MTPTTAAKPDLVDTDVPWCLTDEHRAWRRTMRGFAEDVLRPDAARRNVEHTYDADVASAMGALGLYGILVPEEFGGAGGDLASLCVAIEELARVDPSAAVTVHVQAINAALIIKLGTDGQRAELLPRMASGDLFLSFGLTEPGGGSDAAGIMTRAVRDGDDWLLSGSKQFITNSGTPVSHLSAIVSLTGTGEISLFLVPTDLPGFTVGPAYAKLGWRASDTHPLFLDAVRVPAEAMLGEQGRGFREALHHLTWARIPFAAMSAGVAQGCLEATRDFVVSRASFGKPLAAHQAVAFGVADIAAMTHTARTVAYDACWRYDHGHDYAQAAALSKLVASELANKVAYRATQLHGGYGFIEDSVVTRLYRDARILTIGEGTSEVQRMLIARSLGLDG
ncbi:acyl-CoA dehydrogenase family protein [Streptomyces plumbiresistens]|uniref:Acyl-CoA dehydrogenase family protein n=1 Tax=Streptomyces plumbiresistens TaxID=511811 RepID=A0ABP7TG84_9ACTN